MTPPIGEPRIYPAGTLPVLYPGEVAQARIDPDALAAALQRGETSVPVDAWLVEPMPGLLGWWLRTRYRVWGRWFSHGAPRVEATFAVRQGRL